jgi:hypothetical protein
MSDKSSSSSSSRSTEIIDTVQIAAYGSSSSSQTHKSSTGTGTAQTHDQKRRKKVSIYTVDAVDFYMEISSTFYKAYSMKDICRWILTTQYHKRCDWTLPICSDVIHNVVYDFISHYALPHISSVLRTTIADIPASVDDIIQSYVVNKVDDEYESDHRNGEESNNLRSWQRARSAKEKNRVKDIDYWSELLLVAIQRCSDEEQRVYFRRAMLRDTTGDGEGDVNDDEDGYGAMYAMGSSWNYADEE